MEDLKQESLSHVVIVDSEGIRNVGTWDSETGSCVTELDYAAFDRWTPGLEHREGFLRVKNGCGCLKRLPILNVEPLRTQGKFYFYWFSNTVS